VRIVHLKYSQFPSVTLYIFVNHEHGYNAIKTFCSHVSCFTCYKAISYVQVDCADVVLFWRIQQVLKVTANALRQQVMNREGEYEVRNC
jgi:hypothetical protein